METGFEVDEGIIEDLKVLGASAEVIAATRKSMANVAQNFELLEENVLSLAVFDAMSTQWHFAVGADAIMPVGMNYTVLPFVMRMCGVPLAARKSMFDDMRLMERETLSVAAEKP